MQTSITGGGETPQSDTIFYLKVSLSAVDACARVYVESFDYLS